MDGRRSAVNDPFTPGYGSPPQVWAGRQAEFGDFDEVVLPRVRGGMYERARVVVGDRGVGKTVFLAHLAEDAADAQAWPVRVSARRNGTLTGDLLVEVTRVLARHDLGHALSKRLAGALDKLAGVSIAGTAIDLRATDRVASDDQRGRLLADLLVEAAQCAAERADGALVLLVDEAQNAKRGDLADVAHALQHAQSHSDLSRGPRGERVRRQLPLAAYVAGLPALLQAIRAAGATFFERSKILDFGLLSDVDVRVALVQFAGNHDVGFDHDALDVVVAAVGGYPYFLHLVGSHVWRAGDGAVISVADAEAGIAQARVDQERFYAERLRGLGDLQYDWLRAAAGLPRGRRTVGDVAAELGRVSSELGSTVEQLIGKGLVKSTAARGGIELALPGLDAYLAP